MFRLLWLDEIASGMALLHSNATIHGDLSAFNVMLSR
jgi:tRNA A-37 threonylcarbamoyl transferase component Bud32